MALVISAIPLVIALVWGDSFGKDAYVTLTCARNLATGRDLTSGLAVAGGTPPLRAPLYALTLALLAKLRVPLLQASLVLSALGWSATALVLQCVGRTIERPVAATLSTALVTFSPLLLSTSGTEIAWVIALFWTAILLAIRGRWQAQCFALVLMLWTHFDWSTLASAVLLLGIQWSEQRRFPLRSALILTIATSAWILVAVRWLGTPFSLPQPGLFIEKGSLRELLDESELYWLSFPVIGLGALTVGRKVLWTGLLWGALALAGFGPVAEVAFAVTGLLLFGLGVDWATRWLERQELVQLDRRTLMVSVALIAALPLGVAQSTSLLTRYQARPVARRALERQVGDWLSSKSQPEDTVFGPARIGLLADRPATLWDGQGRHQAEMSALMDALKVDPPQYCVSLNSIAWGWLIQTGWFRQRYQPVKSFRTMYDASSPFTIWGYRSSGFDRGQSRSIDVRIADGVHLVGYQYWPERVEPGDAVYVTLSFQPTRPVTATFRTVVRVSFPDDGTNWAQRDEVTPRSMPLDWWQTGQVISERYVLTTTPQTPVGAYRLETFVLGSGVRGFGLGHVGVPWQGKAEGATQLAARFADQIKLLGFETPDTWIPSSVAEVTLYWEAMRRPDDDYIVFVHLTDSEGQLVTSHDGVPMDRRYPTQAWIPGEVVPDVHRLPLEADTRSGTYSLRVGMYRWPSLERLPVWDSDGIEQADRMITVRSITVP